jgi:hypothetical protein
MLPPPKRDFYFCIAFEELVDEYLRPMAAESDAFQTLEEMLLEVLKKITGAKKQEVR